METGAQVNNEDTARAFENAGAAIEKEQTKEIHTSTVETPPENSSVDGFEREGIGQGGTSFSIIDSVTRDQHNMIDQRADIEVKKAGDKIPAEIKEEGKPQKVIFSKPVRDELKPLINKGATLHLGCSNSIHDIIYVRGHFVVNDVDPVLGKWNVSFRWYCDMVDKISGVQSRGSWNNHRTIYKAFGEKLKTDPVVRQLPERKLLICAKHDDPLEFVYSNTNLIHKSSGAKLCELVTGKKPEKREPTPYRQYNYLGVRAYWNKETEELKLKEITPDLMDLIDNFLDDRDRKARELDNGLSTVLDDGSLDWTEYWAETAKNSEITVTYDTNEGQHTFWNPEKGTCPYGTWAAVIDAVRAENSDAYAVRAEGTEHNIAETSLAESVPRTQVTIPTELLDQLRVQQEVKEKTEPSEEPDPTNWNAESTERASQDQVSSGEEGETADSGSTSQEVPADTVEQENDWTPGEGWTEHKGSLDLRDVFGKALELDERWVEVFVSYSGKMDDGKRADVRDGDDIPRTWSKLIGYLESDEFAPYRGAKLISFRNEEGTPYLYVMNRDGWKVWSNVSAIPLSNKSHT